MRKGVFIPGISVEMFRNASLEAVEEFMVSGLMEDIEIPEIPHGKWIPYTTIDGYTKHATCTNCGYKRKVGMGCSLDIDNLPKFCEGCGAIMEKGGADMRKEGEAE